jgi:patatin-like phospholipase/acyl hydrolase
MKIISIDGGGVRGIIPATILTNLERKLQERNGKHARLCDYFDMACGTSTGGIIAIGIALGVPMTKIKDLYMENAGLIFPKRSLTGALWRALLKKPLYERENLKQLLSETFGEKKIDDCKTRLCVTSYDLQTGKMHVFKTRHHPDYDRDWQISAVDAALSTAAAPVYFSPYSFDYQDERTGKKYSFVNNVDGGAFANNPALIGLLEALRALKANLNEIDLLSLGTGTVIFSEKNIKKNMGVGYWLMPSKEKSLRIYELMSSAQSLCIDNMLKVAHRGVGENGAEAFDYLRIQKDLESDVPLNSSSHKMLKQLEDYGNQLWKENEEGLERYIVENVEPYKYE